MKIILVLLYVLTTELRIVLLFEHIVEFHCNTCHFGVRS